MPDPTGHPAVDTFLIWATVATVGFGLAAGLWRIVRAVTRIARRVNAFFDDWNGAPSRPGVPARPGVMERVRGIEVWMLGVRHELRPNSGQSLRDQVDLANCQLARLLPDGADQCRHSHEPDPPHPPPSPGA